MKKNEVFPPATLLQHTAILGKTGSGKTSTAKLLVEQVVGFSSNESGFRVCVLDPIKSDWHGITSSADGKSPGLPFAILGGPHGHVPLSPRSGAAIGELVARGALPLSIIDMADFKAGGLQKFFVDFADALFRKMRGVLYLVIEEAHEFAPKEKSGIEGEIQAIHYAKKLATAGRSKGIRLVVATQRTQALHNAVLGACDTMVAHRFTAPADQEPIVKWLKANTPKDVAAEISASLSSLKTGTAWLCSGEAAIFEKREFPRIQTFDNSATPTSDDVVTDVRRADVDLDRIRALVGDALEEAAANDPATLRSRIASLERDLAKRPEPSLEQSLARGEEVRKLRERISVLESVITNGHASAHALGTAAGGLEAFLRDSISPRFTVKASDVIDLPRVNGAREPILVSNRPIAPIAATAGRPEGMPKAEFSILRALYWLRRDGTASPATLAFYAGYSVNSSSFSNALSALRTAGHVEGWRITPAGEALIADYAGSLPAGRDLRDWLRPKLGRAENALLDALVTANGRRVAAQELAAASGYSATSSSFSNALSALRSIGAAEGYDRDGGTKAADVLL